MKTLKRHIFSSIDSYMLSTFKFKKDLFSKVILFYLTSNNSTNILIWNVLLISILIVCKVPVGDQPFPHPHAVLFASTTEMTHTPQGPPDAPTLTCGSSTQARLSAISCLPWLGSSQPTHGTAGAEPRLRPAPPSALQTILSWNRCLCPFSR